jgi:hypothetical protein
MFTPAMKLKSSPAMCGALPAPADAKRNPGKVNMASRADSPLVTQEHAD